MPETIPLRNCGAPPTLHKGEVHVHCKIIQQICQEIANSTVYCLLFQMIHLYPQQPSLASAQLDL